MKASLYSGQRASELLPVLAYSDDEQLFFMEDRLQNPPIWSDMVR